MRFPFPKFSRPGKLSRRDTRIFNEACELALLRLEQCISEEYIRVAAAQPANAAGAPVAGFATPASASAVDFLVSHLQ